MSCSNVLRFLAAFGLAVLGLVCAGACASKPKKSLAPVASSQASEVAFRAITTLWDETADRPTPELEHKLRDFIANYPRDGQVQRARVYLAWVFAVTDRRFLARDQLEALGEPSASIRDLAELVHAVQLLRHDQVELALAKLEILKGRFIDETVKSLHAEQLLLAMLATKQYSRAHHIMLDWLELAGGDRRRAIRDRLMDRVREMPSAALETVLAGLKELPGDSEDSELAQWLSERIRQHLELTAVAKEDSELAQRLIKASPGLQGDDQRLAEVAGARPARVNARKIGLVLEFGDAQRERRSAAVLAGASAALNLPESAPDPEQVQLDIEQLVPESDQREGGATLSDADLERGLGAALVRLAGDGASVLIAGVSSATARIAADWASQRRMPVIVLSSFAEPSASRSSADEVFAFRMGLGLPALIAQFDTWAASQGFEPRAVVGAREVPCPSSDVIAGHERFPIEAWRSSGVRAVLLGGGPSCSQRAAGELQRSNLRSKVVLGVFGAPLAAAGVTHQMSTGRFPAAAGLAVPSLDAWAQRRGSFPSWYQALGHDSGLLARLAVEDFPLRLTEERHAVEALHLGARQRLLEARTEDLWTTSSKGFEVDGRLRYPLTVEPIASPR